MPEPELKPCPRCGGEARYYISSLCGEPAYAADCPKCPPDPHYFGTPEKAAAWWNDRPAEAQKDEPARHGEAKAYQRRTPEQLDAMVELVRQAHTPDASGEPKQHQCPYGGEQAALRVRTVPVEGQPMFETSWHQQSCGQGGWLCDRCREDRADARTRALVLATMLAELEGNDVQVAAVDAILMQEGLL